MTTVKADLEQAYDSGVRVRDEEWHDEDEDEDGMVSAIMSVLWSIRRASLITPHNGRSDVHGDIHFDAPQKPRVLRGEHLQ